MFHSVSDSFGTLIDVGMYRETPLRIAGRRYRLYVRRRKCPSDTLQLTTHSLL